MRQLPSSVGSDGTAAGGRARLPCCAYTVSCCCIVYAGFEQKFTLTLCGKHVSSSAARALIVGFGATIVVLLVVMTTMTSSSDSPQDSGAVVPPSAGKSVSSGEQAACAAPPAVTGARYTISPDGMVATYECSQSFSLRGATQLRCTACDSGPEWTVSGTTGSCNRQEAGPACAQLNPAIVSTPPPSPPSPSGAPVSACIDDATCDTLVSQLGCTHDRKSLFDPLTP